ncbi:MAG: GNAT family protein [Litorimonas sp.]
MRLKSEKIQRADTSTVLTVQLAGGAMTLRHPRWADYEDWASLRRENAEYLIPWEPEWTDAHLTRNSYRLRLNRLKKMTVADKAYPFHVFNGQSERIIGACNITHIERGISQSAKLGYWIGQAYTGKGYARNAVRACCQFCFEVLGLHRVEAAVQADNIPSIKVLEAVGFQREGTSRGLLKINGQWRDHVIYAKLSLD